MRFRKEKAPSIGGFFVLQANLARRTVCRSDLGDLSDLGCQKASPDHRKALQANALR